MICKLFFLLSHHIYLLAKCINFEKGVKHEIENKNQYTKHKE